jgi:hypothetical protein
MVAKNKILAFSATDVEINDKQIPIGRSYKELVLAIIENKFYILKNFTLEHPLSELIFIK